MRKALAVASLTFAGLLPLSAQAGEVYGGLGIYGPQLGYAHSLNDQFTVRGDLNGGFKYSRDVNSGGVDYRGKFKSQYAGVYADWFPTASAFRLTGGVTFHDSKVTIDAKAGANANATINGIPVDLKDSYARGTAKFPGAAPYLGIGWGHKNSTQKGWGFYANLGVMIGKFKIKNYEENITTNPSVIAAQQALGRQVITKKDIDVEISKAQSELNKLRAMPVVNVGVTYRF